MSKKERRPIRLAQSDSADMAAPWVGGVASGVADRYGVPVAPVRILFAVLTAVGGAGLIAYMWLWLRSPSESAEQVLDSPQAQHGQEAYRAPMRAVGKRRDQQVTSGRLVLAGSIFLAMALAIASSGIVFGSSSRALLWFVVATIGLLFTWRQAPRISSEARGSAIAYVVLGVLMAVFGTVFAVANLGHIPSPKSGFVASLVVVVVTAIALGPLGMRVISDLTAAKASEARETERADIAAHLHDSVLQTLTLIRGSADDPARVRGLALTQERELRSWLYTGQMEPEVSLSEALSNQAAVVEATYGVPIEVVTVGDLQPGPEHLAAVAAAGEAMTNAARHAKPPITVFQEVRKGAVEIFVKDAGAGFDPDSIPNDRHGFSNSIVGRVERVGGTVKLRFLPSTELGSAELPPGKGATPIVGGTEIAIRIPKSAAPYSRPEPGTNLRVFTPPPSS